jgi:hypothetical protein
MAKKKIDLEDVIPDLKSLLLGGWFRLDPDTKEPIPVSSGGLARSGGLNVKAFVGNYCVSTVFLPVNHGHYPDKPIHFETMIFPAKNGETENFIDLYCQRASTYAEIMAIHEATVKRLEDGWEPNND